MICEAAVVNVFMLSVYTSQKACTQSLNGANGANAKPPNNSVSLFLMLYEFQTFSFSFLNIKLGWCWC